MDIIKYLQGIGQELVGLYSFDRKASIRYAKEKLEEALSRIERELEGNSGNSDNRRRGKAK